GAVVPQNKRAMALLWERIERFPPWAQAAIRRYLPYTVRLERLSDAERAKKDDWVLKSDYGCEGAEVIIGAECDEAAWREALRLARPGRFVLQRRFVPLTDEAGQSANFGVYLVGGVAAGYFTRLSRGATDERALTAPTFIEAGS